MDSVSNYNNFWASNRKFIAAKLFKTCQEKNVTYYI